MLILFLLCSGKSDLLLSTFSKKKLETQKCNDCEVFQHIFENSVLLPNNDKYCFHLLTSVKSLIEHIYVMPDNYVRELTNLNEIPNKHGDFSVAYQIKERDVNNVVDDPSLGAYMKKIASGVTKKKRNNVR